MHEGLVWFEPFRSAKFDALERAGLAIVLLIALGGLAYAWWLARRVLAADQGTPRMQAVARAIREGADAYLTAQFRKIAPLIAVITVLLYVTKADSWEFALGRAT